MSRTFRRRTTNDLKAKLDSPDNKFYYRKRWIPVKGNEKLYVRSTILFEIGDHNFGYHHAPTEFRRDLNRELRTRNASILRRILSAVDLDGFEFIPFRHNADWLYW